MSLEVLQPPSIHAQHLLPPSGLDSPDDSSSDQDPLQHLLQQIGQALQPILDAANNGGSSDPASGIGQSPGACQSQSGGQGGNGLDPQIAEMLAYIARAFEAMMQQQQNSQGADDDGVQGVGGNAAPGAAQGAAPGQGAPAGAGGAPAGAGGASAVGAPAGPGDPAATGAPPSTGAPAPTSAEGAPAAGGQPAAGLSKNDGGVPQAAAIEGVAPGSDHVVSTGPGADKTFNVTNDTDKPESFTYSVQGKNEATITEAPGKTGTIQAKASDVGSRITPSDAQGQGATHPNEVLYEDGTNNPDISKVDGDKDFEGAKKNMTVTLSDNRKAGDGDDIEPYMYPTDDAKAMRLAGDPSKTANIVLSNA